MKAAVLRGNEEIRYEEYADPRIEPGTVLIRVRLSGICGSDVPRVLYHGAHSYPIVLGHEFSGDVDAVGEGVTHIRTGMRVTGAPLLPCMVCENCVRGDYALCNQYSFVGSRRQGSFAEYLLLPARNVVPIGEDVSYEMGALMEPATVALHGLFRCGFQGGVDVAVLGGGTIGQFTAQWARIMGARTVTVLDLLDSRLVLAKRLGCDRTLRVGGADFERQVFGKGAKRYGTVFETSGTPETVRMAFALADRKAIVSFVGTPHQNTTFSPEEWENLNRKELIMGGSWMSYSAPFPGREWELTAHAFQTGRLKIDEGMVHARFPLSQAQEAFACYKKPGRVEGKIFLAAEE